MAIKIVVGEISQGAVRPSVFACESQQYLGGSCILKSESTTHASGARLFVFGVARPCGYEVALEQQARLFAGRLLRECSAQHGKAEPRKIVERAWLIAFGRRPGRLNGFFATQ